MTGSDEKNKTFAFSSDNIDDAIDNLIEQSAARALERTQGRKVRDARIIRVRRSEIARVRTLADESKPLPGMIYAVMKKERE